MRSKCDRAGAAAVLLLVVTAGCDARSDPAQPAADAGAGPDGAAALVDASGPDFDAFVPEANGGLAWARGAGGAEREYVRDADVAADGALLVVGFFEATAVFGAGTPEQTTLRSDGARDAFVARYEPDGTLAWVSRAGGSSHDAAVAIVGLPDGGALVTGELRNVATFEPGNTVVTGSGGADLFLARYSPDGTVAWVKLIESGYGEAPDVAVLADGSIAVVGSFLSQVTLGAGEPTEVAFAAVDEVDGFVARYDGSGGLMWARHLSGERFDNPDQVVALPDGSMTVVGHFTHTTSFAGGAAPSAELTAVGNGAFDLFFARYAANGDLISVRGDGGTGAEQVMQVAGLADGGLLFAGYFLGETVLHGDGTATTLTSTLGTGDTFFARYDIDARLVWVITASGPDLNVGRSIRELTDGSLLVSGDFRGTVTFGVGPDAIELTSHGGADAFFGRFEADGTPRWIKQVGAAEYSPHESATAIAVIDDEWAYVTGQFNDVATFAPGETGETTLTSTGNTDTFVAKLRL